ncbi:MAG: 4-(cytidine 5'-diphospho)-2-C-methyl-D-erythritol kinase [Betaproteobacteria bacterium]|nr:4-(cytidine 5'-diphospho)-2-C-methyl-D-erythritol kinase [Betaproteobacteria bacterium]
MREAGRAFECFPAPAKLNLFLHVIGRRSDGYHLLQSVFRFIDFADEVRLRVRTDGRIQRVTDLAQVPAEQDLCVRAAWALKKASGSPLGVDIGLDKRLPMGGGLGGGSSDAAAVLLALNRLWAVNFPRETLQALALGLGADVPVFVFGQSAFAEGVGERLSAVGLPAAWYVVLMPRVHVSTAAVFASHELTRDTKPIKITDFSAGCGRNDLEPVVCAAYPEVARHLAWLKQHGPARMTGSGACVFAPFESEARARGVALSAPPAIDAVVARGLDRHPLWAFAS